MTRIALVGTGMAFALHAGVIASLEDTCVSACVDLDPQRAEEAARRCGAKAFTSLAGALPHCDAVAICSPPATHRALAVEALEAGKAVLVEKPIAAGLADALAMVEAAERFGMPLMMGFNNRFRDGFMMLRDAIADGTVGKLHSFSIHRQSGGLVKEGVASWRNGPGGVCGHAVESLSHDLDVLRFCAGDVGAVQAFTRCSLPFAPGYDDIAVVSMELKNGAVASLYSDWNSPLGFNRRGASGSGGAVALTGPGNWELRELRIRTNDMPCEEVRLINDSLDATCYTREYRAFLEAVQGKSPPPVTGVDGLRVLEISLAILESGRTGKAVYLD